MRGWLPAVVESLHWGLLDRTTNETSSRHGRIARAGAGAWWPWSRVFEAVWLVTVRTSWIWGRGGAVRWGGGRRRAGPALSRPVTITLHPEFPPCPSYRKERKQRLGFLFRLEDVDQQDTLLLRHGDGEHDMVGFLSRRAVTCLSETSRTSVLAPHICQLPFAARTKSANANSAGQP
jgi:hypothetical protein